MKNFEPISIQGMIAPNIGKTTKCISTLINSCFVGQKVSLTKEQLIVLWRLEEGPRPQSFLAMITERDKGSLTRLVQSLEKKKYIKREVCKEDSRINQVEITKEGRIVLNKAKPILLMVFQKVQNGVSEKEMETTIKVLKKIQNNTMQEIESLDRLNTKK